MVVRPYLSQLSFPTQRSCHGAARQLTVCAMVVGRQEDELEEMYAAVAASHAEAALFREQRDELEQVWDRGTVSTSAAPVLLHAVALIGS